MSLPSICWPAAFWTITELPLSVSSSVNTTFTEVGAAVTVASLAGSEWSYSEWALARYGLKRVTAVTSAIVPRDKARRLIMRAPPCWPTVGHPPEESGWPLVQNESLHDSVRGDQPTERPGGRLAPSGGDARGSDWRGSGARGRPGWRQACHRPAPGARRPARSPARR